MKKKKKNLRKNENNHFQILKMNGASNASPSIINSSSDGGHSSFERQQSSLNRSFGAVVGLGNHVQNKFQNSLNLIFLFDYYFKANGTKISKKWKI